MNRLCLPWLFLFVFSAPLFAEVYVPPELEPWRQWVLERDNQHQHADCPFMFDEFKRVCRWPRNLSIKVDGNGGRFLLDVTVYGPTWVPLPGDQRYWPMDVKNNGEILPVRGAQTPEVYLPKGTHRISGEWRWSRLPETLAVPDDIALATLTVNGQRGATQRDAKGQLWLRGKTEKKRANEQNSQQVRVYRHLSDELPLIMTTQVQLDVSGYKRELLIGPALPEGFALTAISSPLPARVEDDGSLRVQVEPGTWQLELEARAVTGKVEQIQLNQAKGGWPQQEVWVYEAKRHLRQTTITGVPTVDPSQTRLPPKWKNLPAYAVTHEDRFTIKELQRGDSVPAENSLSLSRDIWLSFDGQRFTQQDHISGTLNQGWRLSLHPQYTLGRATVDGQPQLITQLNEQGGHGVELRQSRLKLTALSEVAKQTSLPTSGWLARFDKMSAHLHLPPGWALLAAKGVDRAQGAWLGKWTLWDIFLVMITVVAVARLCSWPVGLLAAATLVLIFHRTHAPLFIWLNIAAVIGLLRLAKEPAKSWLLRYQYLSFALLALILVPFIAQELKRAVYPQLERPQVLTNYSQADLAVQAEPEFLHDEEVVVSAAKSARSESYALPQMLSKPAETPRYRVDPDAVIQTGPGLPQWQWQTLSLSWNGPVSADDVLSLYLIPPWLSRLGHVMSVLLCLMLTAALVKHAGLLSHLRDMKKRIHPLPSTSALLLLVFLGSALPLDTVRAQPDQSVLDELYKRLTQAPACLPACASIGRAHLEAKPTELSLELVFDIHEHAVAVPLPVTHDGWQPEQVWVGNNEAVLQRNPQGALIVALAKGRHLVRLTGAVNQQQVSLPFELNLNNLSYSVEGWQVSGVVDGRVPGKTVQLLATTQEQENTEERLTPNTVAPFVRVVREFNLGLDWTVTTRVERIAPRSGQIQVAIPLIDNEQPTTAGISREGDKVVAVLAASQRQLSWTSSLPKTEHLPLTAPSAFDWAEVWVVNVASLWHMDYTGLAPIKETKNGADYLPRWQPRPGETLLITITRPAPSPGSSLTINNVFINHSLGINNQTTELSFNTLSSIGQEYRFTPPPGVVVTGVEIDSIAQPLDPDQQVVTLPLRPAEQQVRIHWRHDEGATILSTMPAIDFGQEVSNISSRMAVPKNRWPLLVGGPSLGPAVLWWSILLTVTLIAVLLGYWQALPLKRRDWVLLALGTATVGAFVPVLFIIWLALLAYRTRYITKVKQNYFRLIQVALIMLGALALLSLLTTIPSGLLSRPDMHIVGNQSSAYALKWFEDISAGSVEQGWLLSLPMWTYQVAMLLWSLWLATQLMTWLKWAWLQLNAGGFWDPQVQDKPEAE